MLAYFILSCLLSSLGTLLYFLWLRQRLAAVQAKIALSLIIVLSWLIPFLVPELPNYSEMLSQGKVFYYKDYNQWNVVDIKDPALVDCYNKAINSKDMCHCEVIQKANIISFRPDPIYNTMLQCKMPLMYAFVVIGAIFLLEFLIKIGFLIYLAMSSYRIRQSVEGTSFFLLYPNSHLDLPISSFSLWHHYIIWSPLFDELNEEERTAVLLHEIVHLRQHDTWQQILLQLAKVLWWIMPTFYLIRKELNRLNEFVADEIAAKKMGNARKYAALLLKVKELQVDKKTAGYSLPFAQSMLKKRVLYLLYHSKKRKENPLHFGLYIFLLMLSLWTTAAFSLPEIQKQDLKIKQYEVLQSESNKTGQDVFCKSCLQEKLK